MEIIILILAGALISIAVYNLLQKQLLRIIIGTVLISHGAHLFILTMGKLKRGQPLVLKKAVTNYPDSLPQALILTFIIISFEITSLLLVLSYRTANENKTDNMDQLRGKSND